MITKHWYRDTRYRENISIRAEWPDGVYSVQVDCGHHWGAAFSLMSHTARGLDATLPWYHTTMMPHYHHATLLACHTAADVMLHCHIAMRSHNYELRYHTTTLPTHCWSYTLTQVWTSNAMQYNAMQCNAMQCNAMQVQADKSQCKPCRHCLSQGVTGQ